MRKNKKDALGETIADESCEADSNNCQNECDSVTIKKAEGFEYHRKTRFDYYPLKGFIYSNKKLKNLRGYAQFLGIKEQNLATIINNKNRKNAFTQEHIYKTMKEFNLTPEQVVQFFFTESDEPESYEEEEE